VTGILSRQIVDRFGRRKFDDCHARHVAAFLLLATADTVRFTP
jgi:hypothetical protein